MNGVESCYTRKNMYLLENWSTNFFNERLMVNQFFWQRIRKHLKHASTKVRENCRGLKSDSTNGATARVLELAMCKQNYEVVDHFTTWLFGILQKLWLFHPEWLSQVKFSLFLTRCKLQHQLVLFRAFVFHWVVS